MTRQLSITISDLVFDRYLAQETINKSALIEEYIQLGAESKLGTNDDLNKRFIELIQQEKILREENQTLRLKLGDYMAKFDKKLEKQQKLEEDEAERKKLACIECGSDTSNMESRFVHKFKLGLVCHACFGSKLGKKYKIWDGLIENGK